MKHTKIVCTIGPSSSTEERMTQMIQAGMNVARINFSHGDQTINGRYIKLVKDLRKKFDIPIGIMVDLQGPRIRTLIEDDIHIEKGEIINILDSAANVHNAHGRKTIRLDWPGILKDIKKGHNILIEDGLMKITVVAKKNNRLLAKVIEGGTVKNRKGVNIPDAKLQVGVMTKKDEADLQFALEQDVDFIALSFVSNAKEIMGVKAKIKKLLGKNARIPQIVAKIERKEAIKNIAEIIHAADSIMVARGDLGIEMDESKVAIYQKEIIARCLRSAKPVIVATQMLNSMIEKPRPTRAEVSDVSNAVIDHTDAVMLSGETANGKYPIQAVSIMSDIITNTETSPFDLLEHGFLGDKESSVSAAVAQAAHELSKDTKSKAIVVASVSGFAARMIARHRPDNTVYIMTNNTKTHHQLSVVWGVESFMLPQCKTLDELIDRSVETLKKKKMVKKSDKLIIVAGRPKVVKEHMSLVKVEEVR